MSTPPRPPLSEPWVLVPGLMCDRAVWQPALDALAARGPLPPVTVADPGRADSLGAMAEWVLQQAPPRFALAGHSMGGRIALEVWRRAPQRVTRLALLSTGHAPRDAGLAGEQEALKRHALLAQARRDGVAAMARTWVQGMVAPDRLADGALIERIVAMFARRDADTFGAQIRALLARPAAAPVLATVRVPTLVACGEADAWSPPAQHREILSLLHRGVGRLALIPAAGHMAPMEQPEALAALLADWAAAPALPPPEGPPGAGRPAHAASPG